VQQPLSRAITDYQDGHLSLEQLRRQIEDEMKTPEGMRAIRSLLETRNPSLPRPVRDLLVRFSTAPAAVTSLRAAANSSGSWPLSGADPAPTRAAGDSVAAIGPGSVLGGRYRLVREIGRGGMGVVYLADGLVDLQQFAVKVLNTEFLRHPDAIRVLREEARKSLAMRHPNIVGVYPLEREGEQYYLPMEYLEGKTLRDLIDQDFARGVPLDQAWPIVKGAGAALAFAHDHGVIHSDLKPSNIFVTTGGRPRVLDFGIARALRADRKHFDTDSLGALTAAYASCEMLDRKPPDFRDDVYGFACVVYELLTGKHPFGGCTAAEARSRKLMVAPVRALTQAQNAVLRRGLMFNCDDRIATIEEFLSVCADTTAPAGDARSLPWHEVTLPEDAGLRFCGVCGKELPEVARFCPGCGASADAEPAAAESGELKLPGEYRPNTTGKHESRPLGERLAALVATGVAAAVEKAEPAAEPRRLIAFVATGVAVVVAIGLLAFYVVRSNRNPPPSVAATAVAPADTSRPAKANASVRPTVSRPPTVSEPVAGPPPAGGASATAAAAVRPVATPVSAGSPALGRPTALPLAAAASSAPLAGNLAGASGSAAPGAGSAAPGMTATLPSQPTAAPGSVTPHDEDIDHPPLGRHVAAFKLADDSPTVDDACPYPKAAQESGDTGTVALLVYIAADGSVGKTDVESSSDSKVLDDAAVECVEQKLHFVPRRIAGTAVGSWARLKFNWSFGE
jgi:TonB family protein